jgi:GNAT superfamily N-acetyltransferase
MTMARAELVPAPLLLASPEVAVRRVRPADAAALGRSYDSLSPDSRRARPADAAALGRFYDSLSPDSRRARFLGSVGALPEQASRSFCTPDHIHGEGFVAVAAQVGGQRPEIVGHVCLEPISTGQLELAIAVADGQQGRGVGRRLFEAALGWAAERHYRAIVASAFADNARVLRLLSSAPYPPRQRPADGGVVDVIIPLVPDTPEPSWSMPTRSPRHARDDRAVSRRWRVVWLRRPPPAHGAGG